MPVRPTLEEPEDHADLDGVLLRLALDFSEGPAGDFRDQVQALYEVHRFTVARWLWSAHERGLIKELDPTYFAFRVVTDEAHKRLRDIADST